MTPASHVSRDVVLSLERFSRRETTIWVHSMPFFKGMRIGWLRRCQYLWWDGIGFIRTCSLQEKVECKRWRSRKRCARSWRPFFGHESGWHYRSGFINEFVVYVFLGRGGMIAGWFWGWRYASLWCLLRTYKVSISTNNQNTYQV